MPRFQAQLGEETGFAGATPGWMAADRLGQALPQRSAGRFPGLRFIHTGVRAHHKVRPTAHCAQRGSDAPRNQLNYKRKETCLFFDQINNYANFRSANDFQGLPSTDLSTVFVDKYVIVAALVRATTLAYHARPRFWH